KADIATPAGHVDARRSRQKFKLGTTRPPILAVLLCPSSDRASPDTRGILDMPRIPQIRKLAPAAAALLASAAVSAAEREPPDFTGIWTTYTGGARTSGFGGPRMNLPLTAEGRRRVEEYQKLIGPERLNGGAHCADYGVPAMM